MQKRLEAATAKAAKRLPPAARSSGWGWPAAALGALLLWNNLGSTVPSRRRRVRVGSRNFATGDAVVDSLPVALYKYVVLPLCTKQVASMLAFSAAMTSCARLVFPSLTRYRLPSQTLLVFWYFFYNVEIVERPHIS